MTINSLTRVVYTKYVSGYSRIVLSCLAGILFLAFFAPINVNATTPISQSYSTTDNLSLGSVVSLKSESSDQVEGATNDNVNNLLGVVVNADNSLFALSNNQDNQVQVATNGTLQVLVSDISGSIYVGDQITASPMKGVGMKATSNVRVVGIAQSNLDNTNGSKQSYTKSDGTKDTVLIGQIPVMVNVSYYYREPDRTLIPQALQNVANALAGKSVSALPIIISTIIFVVMIIVVSIIIYSMIRSSIISVGRNPMSQAAIYRDLIQLSVLVIVIMAVSIGAIYLVLTRM